MNKRWRGIAGTTTSNTGRYYDAVRRYKFSASIIILLAKHVIGLLPAKFILSGSKGRGKIVNDNWPEGQWKDVCFST